ncbi:MAG: hypothetical protein HZB91_09095 [Elusimicrobia bacterium]|nr:hypothetical protein [Elusimicrobiota bacterium]
MRSGLGFSALLLFSLALIPGPAWPQMRAPARVPSSVGAPAVLGSVPVLQQGSFSGLKAVDPLQAAPGVSVPGIAALPAVETYDALLKRQEEGEVLDLSGVTRPGIAYVRDGRFFVGQGSGRYEALSAGEWMDLFVPEDSALPEGAVVTGRGITGEVVLKANLLSSRGVVGSKPDLLGLMTEGMTFTRVLAPRELVEAPFSRAGHEVRKMRSFLEDQAAGWGEGYGNKLRDYLEGPDFQKLSLNGRMEALSRLRSAAAKGPSAVASLLIPSAPADSVPEWPGKPGDTVRINGRSYVLGEKLGEGTGAWVYRVQGRPLVVKLVYPGFAEVPVFGSEVAALEEMAGTRIPHARMRDHSQDGLVIVKDFVSGERIFDIAERGELGPEHVSALVDLAAELLTLERTADLNLGNLLWDARSRSWILIDSGGFAKGPAWGVLGQLLSRTRMTASRLDPQAFLKSLAAKLGEDSAAWKRVVETPRSPDHQELVRSFLKDRGRP